MIRYCESDDRYFPFSDADGDEENAEGCPDCGSAGREVLGEDKRVRLSKFMSGALRHFPDDAGLSLNENGWTGYDELVETAVARYDWARPEHVECVVETDPKGRFERNEGRIRAAYGHSVDVSLEDDANGPKSTPDTLYHGTAQRNAKSIEEEGIVPKGRREVYLSETVEEAREVGSRHGEPIVFEVDTTGLEVVERGDGVYGVECVPPEKLSRL